MIHGNLSDLAALLDLAPLGVGRFAGSHVSTPRSRVYGGQFLGQGLVAASRLCSGNVRSFHAYYLRPATTDTPLIYTVDDPVAAGSNTLASVQASQDDKLMFCMDAAFGDYGPGPDIAMPEVAPPEDCISRSEGIQGLATNTDSTWAVTDSPFDYRFAENIWQDGYARPGHHVWFRRREPRPVEPALPQPLAQAVTAYFVDDPIMDNALFPHGWQRCWNELLTASLDHAMWFHAPVDLDEWLLFAQDSPVAAGGRAITRGLLFDQQGQLLASACQEILMRTVAATS